MSIRSALGFLRRKRVVPIPWIFVVESTITSESQSATPITLGSLAHLGVVWAMNGERFDCCEVWYDGSDQAVHVRMCDQRMPGAAPKGCVCFRAYSLDGTKPDGSELYATFETEILEWSVDRIKALINSAFAQPLALVKP